MRSHLRSVAKRKVSDFLLREEGMVGNRSAFATAALVSTTALAATLIVAPDAGAHGVHCPDGANHCPLGYRCCAKYAGGRWLFACVDARNACP